jgi:putative protease
MESKRKLELLAPAGDSERLHFAVKYGADAVYVGTEQFSMRSAKPNFDRETLRRDVVFAHENGVKVYLTCNSLPRNDEVPAFEEYVQFAKEIGIDALIIADLGLFAIAKKSGMDIHMSTQTGIVNYQTANTLYKMGAKRVVLARELSLLEIAEIRRKTPPELELECFVHGSMCMSFSGRCLLSQYLTNRDANRGACSQPCRWKYALAEETRDGVYFPVEEDENGSYILNAEDLNMIAHLDELIDAGVTSFKIEGRAKSSYYVAIVTNAYKNAIILSEMPEKFRNPSGNAEKFAEIEDELNKVSHRPYGTGFFFSGAKQYYPSSGYIREYDVAAVINKHEDGKVYCEQRNKLVPGTTVEIVFPYNSNTDSIFKTLTIEKLFSLDGEEIHDTRHAKMPFYFEYRGSVLGEMTIPPDSIIRAKGLK